MSEMNTIRRTESSVQVITMCSLPHEVVWRLTSALLPRLIRADDFAVYVPENEEAHFAQITPRPVRVLPKSLLNGSYVNALHQALVECGNSARFGWYLQQFHKIEAILQSPAELVAIWDADCVPLRPIDLFDEIGRPIYMEATEYNEEYFRAIDRLVGIRKSHGPSFVIPGFPTKKVWVQELVDAIEKRHKGKTWQEAIICSTDLHHASGFSETETIGTWIAANYPNSWSTQVLSWERHGQSRFGYASEFNEDQLVSLGHTRDIAIISFENWDQKGTKGFARRLKRALNQVYRQLRGVKH